ncbi:MAG: Mechanosensitive ion channel [Rhodobacteraceae bacterium HLUCCA08]|nr:MAG: Mechanosensitive ion channel [Rhodobacteraceae bacterium HLUCCA08]
MPRPPTWVSGLACAAALAAGVAVADTPLRPPYDYIRTAGTVTVAADAATLTTTITAADGTVWTVPAWSDFIYPSVDGRAVLLTPGAQLAASTDPDLVVGTIHGIGPPPVVQPLPLGLLHAAPQDLPRTASHVVWHTGITAGPDGWIIDLPGGGRALIRYP